MRYSGLLLSAIAAGSALAYDPSRNDNLVVYWGQNSYGATHGSDTANWQKSIGEYCNDDTIDVLPISFVTVFFGAGGLPQINLANTCNEVDDEVFPGTALANCSKLAEDIKKCQAKGKVLPISLGGATGAIGFTSDAQAEEFATTVWNTFLGGSSDTRPFGDAVLDGIDLDIEGGSPAGYTAFVNKLRTYYDGASKPYYVFAAPQCVFPDAYLGDVLNNAKIDGVFIQFYNNACGLPSYPGTAWNFNQWADWAANTSPNKNVKLFIGAPASTTAAGSGFVDINTLKAAATDAKSSANFGGIMLWDASQAKANGGYDAAAKAALTGSGFAAGSNTPPAAPAPRPNANASSSSCKKAEAWDEKSEYTHGLEVQQDGHLWSAKWGTINQVPGDVSGVWEDLGSCKTARHARDFSA